MIYPYVPYNTYYSWYFINFMYPSNPDPYYVQQLYDIASLFVI